MTTNFTEQEIAGKPQNSEVILEVKGVSKKFCRDLKRSLFYGVQDIASELVGTRHDSEELRQDEFWALKDVSFQLRRGEALGLVGPNGSGKTTLLRIISGLIKADSGFVEIKGRIAPLIALGAGFNPILTGRENIYANMSILGLSKKEIDKRLDTVLEFAEIEDAIDAPLQTYSSGMAARLGFACAIHIEPDILLIDEVLAVGDIKFQAKCYRKLAKMRENGTSFILVTHNPQVILATCKSAIYLSKGELLMLGETDFVMKRYEEDLFTFKTQGLSGIMYLPKKQDKQSLVIDIISLSFRDKTNNILEFPITGNPAYFCIECQVFKEIKNPNVSIAIIELFDEMSVVLCLSNLNDNQSITLVPGKALIQIKMPYFGLKPGVYDMQISIAEGSLHILDVVQSFRFTVKASKSIGRCKFYQPRTWAVEYS